MNSRRPRLSRRDVLAGAALAAGAVQAASARTPPPRIRPAALEDISGMADLLVRGVLQRRRRDPAVWPVAADARARIEAALRAGLAEAKPALRELWLIADHAGRMVGVAHAMFVPVPPIFGVTTGPPALLQDDCFVAADARPGTAQALLEATEDAVRAAGGSTFIAACPPAGPWRRLLEQHGYGPVTLYMARHGFQAHAAAPAVRPATPADIDGVVRLSADHRRTLFALNPRFWPPKADADRLFDGWMRTSLTLADRDMMVLGPPRDLHGYVIAQPVSPVLIPTGHDIRAVGVIDDFYDLDFADAATVSGGGRGAAALIAAAERAFARRGVTAALAVCPAAWTSKVSVLKAAGYRPAKLWMLKR